jgi:cytochrome c peroxidase
MKLFFGRAQCAKCHSGPNFTDSQFHSTGIPGTDPGRAVLDRVGEFQMRPYPFFQMQRAFKTPGLRNAALTAPYFHDGSEATLLDVVRFYDQGGKDRDAAGLSPDVRPLKLSEREKADLVAFLESLTAMMTVEPPPNR